MNAAKEGGGTGTGQPQDEGPPVAEVSRQDSWWYRVYLAVIVVTVLVIAALWAFSRAYSS